MPPSNRDAPTNAAFIKVTHAAPCPVCGKPDWCSLFADGKGVICMRVESDHPTKNGGWIHFFEEKQSRPTPPRIQSVPTHQERANPTMLDMVYRSLRQQLTLSPQHHQDLLERGLTPEEIRSLRYVSLPFGRERAQAVYPLIESYGPKLLQVPGFCLSRGHHIQLLGAQGLMVFCRDIEGHLVGAQIRVDGAQGNGKYRWLSAPEKHRRRGGVSSGTPIHVAKPSCTKQPEGIQQQASNRVWITEGILKADIASLRLQETVLGIAGVASWKQDELQHILDALKPSEVILAFDADAQSNKAVRTQRMRLGKALLSMGYQVSLATWDIEQGKGLDDLLVAGHTPTLKPFRPAPMIDKLHANPKAGGLKRVKRITPSESDTTESDEPSSIIASSPLLRDIDTLRAEMSEDMRHFLLHSQPGEARLYQATQGLGKTHTAMQVTHSLWEEGILRPVVAFPRHALIDENLPFPWQHLQPRQPLRNVPHTEQPDLCRFWEQADMLGSKRWNVVEHLCKRECPIGTSIKGLEICPYIQQYNQPDPLTTVHETLFIPYFAEQIFRNGELPLLGIEKQAVVLDEPEPGKFIDTVSITAQELSKAIARCRDKTLRQLLHLLHQVVGETAHREDTNRLLGREAMDWMVEQSGGETIFAQLLEKAVLISTEETNTVLVAMDSLVDETTKAWWVNIDGQVRSIPKSVADPVDGECLRVAEWFAEKEKLPILGETPLESGMASAECGEKNDSFRTPHSALRTAFEVPLNFQSDLLNVLIHEFEQWKQGTPYNSSLVLTMTTQPTIRLNLRKHFAVPAEVPVILLDGQGHADLLSKLLRRQVTTWKAPARLNAHITQIVDGNYGITSLWNSKTKEPKPSFWRLWEKVAQPLIDKAPQETVLITWKAIADYLKEMQSTGQIAPTLAIGHYGGVKGSNEYEDRHTILLLGTPQASPSDTEELAHALFVDETPISTETEDIWKAYPYTDSDGCGYKALVKQYQDPRMEMLARLHKEDELVQAAHRIRPVLTQGKHIYLLTSLPVEELPPTRLISVDELAVELGARPDMGIHGITYRWMEHLLKDFLAEESSIWFEELKSLINKEVLQADYKEKTYSERENPHCFQGIPSDSTLRRWMNEIAKENGWIRSRVTIKKNDRGGGATSVAVYHLGEIDEASIRERYQKEWQMEPEDTILIELWPIMPEEYEEPILVYITQDTDERRLHPQRE